jgi:hypothetical protein
MIAKFLIVVIFCGLVCRQCAKLLTNLRKLAGAEGLEPSTLGFGDRCSTN